MMQLNQLSEIAAWLSLQVPNRPITGFAVDSRRVQAGNLFFALPGERFDGHLFLKEVAARGGVAAVVAMHYKGDGEGVVLLPVVDVLGALHHLAQEMQRRRCQRVIAVTGSTGKTTTKEFIATLLAKRYSVAKTPGNANSQIGFPLAILNDPGHADVFVAEMGMERPGEIGKLVTIAPPEIGVITNVGHQHFQYFTNIEQIAAAKAEILLHPLTRLGVVHAQTLRYNVIRNAGTCCKKNFAMAPELADFVLHPGWTIQQGQECSSRFSLPFVQTHFCEDFLAAATVARVMGLSWEEIGARAVHLQTAPLRFQLVERDGIRFINDCYNADPESIRSAVHNLPLPAPLGKTVAVFGEMTGLGSYTHQGHTEVATLALHSIDHLLCYGELCRQMVDIFTQAGKPASLFHDLCELRQALLTLAHPGDVVLIKGSNSNQLWQILEGASRYTIE